MLVPLSWLDDFAPFSATGLTPAALGEVFDDLGMVVEGITIVGEGLTDVVVAAVQSIDAIDGADKIRKIVVDAGGGAPLQIVCGAWNFEVGDRVPLARVGTVLPGGFEIGRRKMRGVASEGMLCSARELGLGDDAGGLLVLPSALLPGTPLIDALGLTPDAVFDLAIEGNRPDANCIAGVARDAAARLKIPFSIPVPPPLGGAGPEAFEVRATAPDLCDRFTATVFSGLAVGPSPDWIARRLSLAGMRPISNVVDASNYVMLELGQPTHAYDLDRLPGAVLGVRAARAGEELTTLDDVVRSVGRGTHPDAVITDGQDVAIGIAGVMGGASSEVHAGTARIVLEAAHFVPMAIARTSKRLGLRSEASARFERGVDVDGIERSITRFAEILRHTCPDLAAEGATTDWRSCPAGRTPITVRVGRVNAVLGTALAPAAIESLLGPIGFAVLPEGPDTLDVSPPSFRPDVTSEIEVIEEVARHHGYAAIVRTTVRPGQVGALTPYQHDRRRVRAVLAGAGLSEAMASPLVGPGEHARAGLPGEGPRAVDPLVREESILRTSLLPGLLRAVAFNVDRRTVDVGLFEIGHVWPGGNADELPLETEMLGVIMAGAGAEARSAVGVLHRLTGALRVRSVTLRAGAAAGLHPTRGAEVIVNGTATGWVGEVDPDVVAAWGIEGRVAWVGVDLGVLLRADRRDDTSRPVSRFPSSDVDLAFVTADDVAAAEISDALSAAAGQLLEWVALFDVYRGPGVPTGSRSLAFRLRLVAHDHTLTDDEIADVRRRCIEAVEQRFAATLRA